MMLSPRLPSFGLLPDFTATFSPIRLHMLIGFALRCQSTLDEFHTLRAITLVTPAATIVTPPALCLMLGLPLPPLRWKDTPPRAMLRFH